mgnify:CR=1 FL=1
MAIEKTIILKADTTDVDKKLKSLDKKVEKTTTTAKKSGKGLSSAFKGMGTSIGNAIPMLGKLKAALISTGVGAIVVALGAFVGLMKSAAEAGADFQKGLSTLRAVTGSTADELLILNDQAKELGSTTQFTAIEVVGLQTELAKLGFTIKDIKNSTPAILDLAASLEVDLASAAEFAGSVVRSFGLTTEDTQRVVDVMAKSTSTSALNFEALKESIKVVAPAARATGVSIEKTAALLGILANNGLKGSVAGTGLSKSFIELNKKGITLEQGMAKVAGSSNKLNTAIELVGVVGAKSFLSLAESGQAITDLEQQFLGAEGAAKSMAEVRLDNLEGDMTKLGSAWEGFLLGIEDGEGPLNDLQRTLVKGLTNAVSGLGKVVDFLAFVFTESFDQIVLNTQGAVDLTVGLFSVMGNGIKIAANEIMLAISEIPIIGQALDKSRIEANIKEAEEAVVKGSERIQSGIQKFQEAGVARLTRGARYTATQVGKAERIAQAAENKALEEQKIEQEQESEENRLKREKAQEEAQEELRKQIKKAADQETKNKLSLLQQIEDAENDFFNRGLTRQELEVQAVNDKYFALIEAAKLYNEDTKVLEAAQSAELLAIKTASDAESVKKKAEADAAQVEIDNKTRKAKEENLAKVGNALSSFSELAGKETAAGKALAIASTLIQTYQSAQSSYASLAGIPVVGPALGVAAAGAAVFAGMKQIQNIKKTKVPNGGGGASAGGGGSVGAAPTPPSFNVVGASETSALGDAVAGQANEPVQAYVVSNDVTTAQSLQNNIVDGATI